MNGQTTQVLTPEQLEQYSRDGYLIVRGFLSRAEAEEWREHFMALHARGAVEGFFAPKPMEETNGDLLKAYPRMLQPHRWDETCRGYLLDSRFEPILRDLLDDEPLAAQSMCYFKPPGARGQALHQDDFYLRTAPGQCLAAWLSLEDTDSQNGGLFVVPGSHKLEVLCPHAADLTRSFTIEEVDIPPGMEAIPADLQMGDVLFFSGNVIHGSHPNVSRDRFRRSFICHYVTRATQAMSLGYSPLLSFAGEDLPCESNGQGGPCGTEELDALRAGTLAQGELARVGMEQGAIAPY